MQERRSQLRRAVATFNRENQRNPSAAELVELRASVEINPAQWASLAPWLSPSLSLDAHLAPGDSDATLADLIASDGPSPDDDLEKAEQREAVAELLATLPQRETKAIRLRYGIGCPPYDLQEIGRELRVSSERARQLLAKAMRRLRTQTAPQPVVEKTAA